MLTNFVYVANVLVVMIFVYLIVNTFNKRVVIILNIGDDDRR